MRYIMKRKRIITILISVCCLSLALICIVGCGNEITLQDNERYGFKKIDNKPYLILADSESDDVPGDSMSVLGSIEFDSVEEFIDTVANGKLTDSQLKIANRSFKRDSNGIIICDFNDIQVPVYPKDFELTRVHWSGELYSFSLVSSDESFSGDYHYVNEEVYNLHYKNENLFENPNVTVTQVVENPDNTEYYYSTSSGKLKTVKYTLTDGDKELIVYEKYRLDMVDALDKLTEVSDEIPYGVAIYGNSSGKLFYITIFDLKTKPTREWLNGFDIKSYK